MEPELAIKVGSSAAEALEVQTVLNRLERTSSEGGLFQLEPGEQVQVGFADPEDDLCPVRGARVVKLNERARPSSTSAWCPLGDIAEAGLHAFQLEEGPSSPTLGHYLRP